jgi:hypothetical protein
MRYTLAVASVAAGLGVGGGLLIGWRTAYQPPPVVIEKEMPPQPTPAAKKDSVPKQLAEKPGVEIPLSEIYTTSGQHGMKVFPTSNEEVEKDLKELTKRLEQFDVPTTFHVAAYTAASALDKTVQVFTRGKETRFILRTLEPEWEKPSDVLPPLWVFLSLGTQNHSPYWWLTSVVQKDLELVIRYNGKDGQAQVPEGEVRPHCYWIPLKPIAPGKLTIRVFDELRNQDAILIRARLIK